MAEGQPVESSIQDAKPNTVHFKGITNLTARMPAERNAVEYNMKHKYRGKALIFSHQKFNDTTLSERKFTTKDCERLDGSLKKLQFDVHIYKDKTTAEIMNIMATAAGLDHTDNDCILIVVLSHGNTIYINTKDSEYKLETLASHLTADKCPTLAGKPKLFFIQACQGDKSDPGITLRRTETEDGGHASYRIPIFADFLFAYSTIPGFVAFADKANGAWFIQSLCEELDTYGKVYDILTVLTFVCQRVAVNFESISDQEWDKKKQVPCTTTMLTRILRFSHKN